MEKIINNIQYEENIFFLKQILNSIDKGINININPELFQKKIKDDLIFINRCKTVLLDKLLKNERLISRNTLLQKVITLLDSYNTIYKKCIERTVINQSDFNEIISNINNEYSQIEVILSSAENNSYKEDLTTNKELNILLMDSEE